MSIKGNWGIVALSIAGATLASTAIGHFFHKQPPSAAKRALSEEVQSNSQPSSQQSSAPTVYVVERAPAPATSEAAPAAAVQQDPAAEREPAQDPAVAWDARFTLDEARPRDASQRESLIRSAFTAPSVQGANFNSVECHANICKAGVTFADDAADRAVIREVLLAPDSPVMQHMGVIIANREPQANGSVVATMYFYGEQYSPAAL